MLKLIFCLTRLPTLSREQFQDYWRNKHAPLVVQHAAALRMCRYSQLSTIDNRALIGSAAIRGAPPAYDGLVEACFDSVEDFLAAKEDPEAIKALEILRADEKNFLDHSRSPIFFVKHEEIFSR